MLKAFFIACKAHKGQKDKAGKMYIFHPLTVAKYTKGRKGKIVALLHDVVEDSSITIDDLKKYGFTDEITHAVDAITKRAGEAYYDYLQRVKSDEIARAVKISDLMHNSNLARLKAITEKDVERTIRYQNSIKFLL